MVAAERRDPSRRRVFIMCGFTKHMIMPSVFCVMGASPQSGEKSAFQSWGELMGTPFTRTRDSWAVAQSCWSPFAHQVLEQVGLQWWAEVFRRRCLRGAILHRLVW